MEIDLKAAGARIKQIRKQHKYSMAAMAKLVGTSSASTVNNWEKGNNLPNKGRLEKIAILGNTTVEWLIYGDFPTYVLSLLTGVVSEDKLSNPEFVATLIDILKREHVSYTDDLQILTIAKKLYLASDPTMESNYSEEIMSGVEVIYEGGPVYKIEKNAVYRQELLPELEKLLSEHADAILHLELLTTFLDLLEQAELTVADKEELLALLKTGIPWNQEKSDPLLQKLLSSKNNK